MSLILRQVSELYALLIQIPIDPVRADEHELWQLAALMGGGQDNPNDPDEINRRMIAARYEAAAEGRELDAEALVSGMSEEQVAAIGGSVGPSDGRL